MVADAVLPGGRLLSFASTWKTLRRENVTTSLIADVVAQLSESAGNAVVAPGAILLGHLDDQVFELLVDTGSPHGLSLLRTIEFLRHQLTMPGENRVGFDDGGDFCQGLLAELLDDLSQDRAFGVGPLNTPRNLLAQGTARFDHEV